METSFVTPTCLQPRSQGSPICPYGATGRRENLGTRLICLHCRSSPRILARGQLLFIMTIRTIKTARIIRHLTILIALKQGHIQLSIRSDNDTFKSNKTGTKHQSITWQLLFFRDFSSVQYGNPGGSPIYFVFILYFTIFAFNLLIFTLPFSLLV